MNIIEKIKENAKKANKRIVLAEGEEERTLKAADIIIENGYAAITLLGNKANIEAKATEWGLKNIAKADISTRWTIQKKISTQTCCTKSAKTKA